MADHRLGSLDYYLDPSPGTHRANNPVLPHEVVAWRKVRNGRWIEWTFYGRYSWKNIQKWVTRRGDVYQVATANGQIVTVKRRLSLFVRTQDDAPAPTKLVMGNPDDFRKALRDTEAHFEDHSTILPLQRN